ncbi:MAG TPA: glycine--tRNA ligase subunit beta [Rhodanobacteraceae bacterium]|nr:glycine--tRNA ligase subunit beta [Rhodanobacteraceae bacterium]
MSTPQSLLIELGTEELPPKALDDLAAAFAGGIVDGLSKRGLAIDAAAARSYCSPRRLAVWIPQVADAQLDQAIERRGPALAGGRDAEGQPSRALLGFAQSCGVAVDELTTLETDKGAWFVHRATQAGQPLAALLPEVLAETLKALPIPRPMRWGDHDYSFVRPAHWLVVLHGAAVIELELLGLHSGRESRGHRFHHPEPVTIADADAWLGALRAVKVLADPVERRRRVREQVETVGADLGGTPRLSEALLAEIGNLVEWPVAIACAFEPAFLKVPAEALVTTMETNQKFVPVFDAAGQLTAQFIGVANIESKDPGEIRKGYERVIRPRFADAKFFFEEDLKTPLAGYQAALKNVTYQQALGSVWDKTCRVAELARIIANRVGVDAGLATHAASLAKCDLMTRMVGEFPELQGVMGRYYAAAHGEPAAVAQALDECYQPRQSGDPIAVGAVARVLAVAERFDTLAGIFAVGMKPSGSKDPFALRRAAQGLGRTLIEGGLDIELEATFLEALELVPEAAFKSAVKAGKDGATAAHDGGARRAALAAELRDFVIDRLRGYYAEQGFGAEPFDAVLAVNPPTLVDFDRRLRAVAAFAQLPQAASLAAANKRVGNILRKQADAAPAGTTPVDPGLFELDTEHALLAALDSASGDSEQRAAAGDYAGALARLAELQAPVDHYFDTVLVMADDAAVRTNRLALLARLHQRFLAIADIGRL